MNGSGKAPGKQGKLSAAAQPSRQGDLRSFFAQKPQNQPKPSPSSATALPHPQQHLAQQNSANVGMEPKGAVSSHSSPQSNKKRVASEPAESLVQTPTKRQKSTETMEASPSKNQTFASPNDRRSSLQRKPSAHDETDDWLDDIFGSSSSPTKHQQQRQPSPPKNASPPKRAGPLSTSFSFDLGEDEDLFDNVQVQIKPTGVAQVKNEPLSQIRSSRQPDDTAGTLVKQEIKPDLICIDDDDEDSILEGLEPTRPSPPRSAPSTKRLSLMPKAEPKQEHTENIQLRAAPIPRERLPAKLMSPEASQDEAPPSPTKATSSIAQHTFLNQNQPLHLPAEFTNLGQSLEEYEQFQGWIMNPDSGIQSCVLAGIFARGDSTSFRLTEEVERKVASIQCRALALLFPYEDGSAAAAIPLEDGPYEVPLETRRQLVWEILENLNLPRKICFNAKQLMKSIFPMFEGRIRSSPLLDIQVAAYVYDPELSDGFSFSNICKLFLRQEVKNPTSFTSSALSVLGEDLKLAERVAAVLEKRLVEEKLWDVFWDQECRISTLLALMEVEGISFDSKALGEVSQRLTDRLKELQALATQKCGFQVNLASPKALSDALYVRLKLKPATVSSSKTRGGGTSTNEDALKSLQNVHPLPGIVLQYRKAQKLLTTYVDKLGSMVQKDGRIHTLWDHMGTGTGRLSSRDPNLQNIPRAPYVFKSKDPRRPSMQEVSVSVSIRSAFIAAEGKILVGADYSQLEMRLLAHVAEDKTLEMFFSSGKDVHSQVASHWKKKPIEQVLPQEREYAKRLVYGIMYGMGPKALADHLNVSQQEARKFMNEFMSSYPAVKKWIDKTIAEAKRNHQVRTLYGRRRLLVADGDDASRADRQAVNSIVQGTAADIVKRTSQAEEARNLVLMLVSHSLHLNRGNVGD